MAAKTLVLLEDQSSIAPDQKILGISFRERVLIPAGQEGFEMSSEFGREVLILPSSILFSRDFWKRLSQVTLEDETVLTAQEDLPFALVKTRRFDLLRGALAHGNAPKILQALVEKLKKRTISVLPKDWVPVRNQNDLPHAERWLLQGLIKDNEGFMSRHLERKISLFATQFLVRTPVTPNQMTFFSTGIGLAGSLFFLAGSPQAHFTGALLFWLHSVLDGCDGEIARLKFLESRLGGVFDFWGDNLVHAAVFFCIALGLLDRSPGSHALLLGALAVSGTLASAAFVYGTTMRKRAVSGPLLASISTNKFIDFLARRDFIYLVILLSIFGKIHWFLWMGAAGSPIYFFILAGLHLQGKKELS